MAFSGQIIHNPISGERIHFLRTARDTNGELLEFELQLTPDGKVPGAHVHPEQEERFHVVEGTMKFKLGFKTIVAQCGGARRRPRRCAPQVRQRRRDHRAGAGRGRAGAGHGAVARDDRRARARRPHAAFGHAEAAAPRPVRPALQARGAGAVPARVGGGGPRWRLCVRSPALAGTMRGISWRLGWLRSRFLGRGGGAVRAAGLKYHAEDPVRRPFAEGLAPRGDGDVRGQVWDAAQRGRRRPARAPLLRAPHLLPTSS